MKSKITELVEAAERDGDRPVDGLGREVRTDRLEISMYKDCNVARMMDALGWIASYYDYGIRETMRNRPGGVDWEGIVRQITETANDALAAPPRNCDVGTAEEQAERFHKFCTTHHCAMAGMCDPNCPCGGIQDEFLCICRWAQLPYEEGGK